MALICDKYKGFTYNTCISAAWETQSETQQGGMRGGGYQQQDALFSKQQLFKRLQFEILDANIAILILSYSTPIQLILEVFFYEEHGRPQHFEIIYNDV